MPLKSHPGNRGLPRTSSDVKYALLLYVACNLQCYKTPRVLQDAFTLRLYLAQEVGSCLRAAKGVQSSNHCVHIQGCGRGFPLGYFDIILIHKHHADTA